MSSKEEEDDEYRPPLPSNNNAEEEGIPGSKSANGANATAKDTLGDAQRWTNRYGALILFFEKEGHTNVPSGHVIHSWVAEQRVIFRELSDNQIKQLRMLNFWFPGQPHSPNIKRCLCNKFAAFNGFCHEHYSANPTATATPPSIPVPAPAKKPKKKTPPKPRGAPKQAEFPLVGLRRRKNGNYDIESKNEKVKNIAREEVINRLNVFINRASNNSCGDSIDGMRDTSCNCLQFLNDKPFISESVSHAIMNYYDSTPLQRKHYAVDRLRCAEMGKHEDPNRKHHVPQRIFSLPLSYEYFEQHHLPSNANKQEIIGQAFKHRICSHAFYNLHHIGRTTRRTLDKYVNGDISVGQHGNAGKIWAGANKFVDAYESLRDSLNMLTEEYRQNENAKGDIILPLQISKRKSFELWVSERGWIVKKHNKATGQYAAPEDWDVQPGFYKTEEEAIANGGDARNVAKVVFTWAVYARFWAAQFPHLITQGRVGAGMHGGKYDFEKKKYYT